MNYAGKFDATFSTDGPGQHPQGQAHVETMTRHATHAPADAIIVPDAQLLFNGDFKREGVDLVLSHDHHELVLHDYFKGEKRAALSSPDGAHLTGDLVNALTGYTEYAQADGSAGAGKVIGHVTKLAGTATIVRNGVSIILNNGDNVEKGDVVQSGSDSTLGITFIDGTVFGLSSNARMVLNEMVYDPNGSNNSSLISLVAGTISFVAGETAKHGDMKVDTPVATMGIRGTAVLVEIDFNVPGTGGAPDAKFQVLVEPDGTTGSYILFDKNTLTPIATVNQAGQQINISQGQVSITNAPLPPDIQKLITDVFSLKFTDSNPKSFDHFTDFGVPQSLQPIYLQNGTSATPIIIPINVTDKATAQSLTGPTDPSHHIPGPPAAAIVDASGHLTSSFSITELVGRTHAVDPDSVSVRVNWADVNPGDTPTASVKFGSATYQNAAHVTSALSAQQLADIAAIELNLVPVPTAGNNNNGSATITYSLPDNAFDFLAAGESVTLTYLVDVHNNFAANDEVSHLSFTITIDGTNDVPTLAATSAAVAEHSGATDHAGGTITFTDVDLTDRPVVSTAFSSFTYKDSHGNDIALTPTLQAEIAAVESGLTLKSSLTNANNGTVTWSYDIADGKLGFLADGDLLTLTYMASVDDGHGGLVSTPITVTILGVSDVPFPISEQSNETQPNPTGSNVPDTVSGTLTFTGVDLSNVQSVGNTLISVIWSGGSVLPSGLVSTLESSLTESVTSSVGFNFSAADKTFDFLADGETLAIIYDVTVTDSHGFSTTRPVTFIVTGTNDTPAITSETQAGAITESSNPSQPNPTGSTALDTATGTVTFTDVDLNDHHTVSVTGVVPSGVTSGLPGNNDVLSWLSLGELTDSTGSGTGGSDAWTFSAADKSFDYLAAGETLTLTYTVQVDDGHGGVVTQPVTITVTGTNDTPVITSGTQASAITELANAHQPNPTGSLTADTATGAVTFTDVDLSDQHLVTITGVVASGTTSGLPTDTDTVLHWLSLGTLHDTTGTGLGGSDAWTFSAADKSFDYLAAGETLTLTYTVQVDDGHGGVVTQPVTITVTGTNDTPVITSGTQASAITELANAHQPNPTGSLTADTATGAVTFTDVDLSDQHLVTISGVVASGTTSGLPTDTDTVLHWLSLGTLHDTTGTGLGGSDAWTFSAADKSFDYLAAGETLTLTYTVQVDDGHGGVVTQPVTITVTGTNDTPVITSGTQAGAITELSNPSQPNPTGSTALGTATGAVTFTDVDLSDHHTVTVTGVVASGITSGLPTDTDTVLHWLSLGTLHDTTGTGLGGSDAWTFSAADKSFDYLAAGETLTLTYTVQVDDGHGGVVTQPATITVTGTNDTPHITSGTQAAAITELANAHQPNPTGSLTADTATGAVTFTDVDLSDQHLVTITGVVASGTTSGLPTDTDTVLHWLSLGTLHDTTGTGLGGSDAWTFSAADKSFDYLAAGETLTLTYTVQVDDGHGGVVTQPVTITVTGTNDTPVITSGTQASAITELANAHQPNPTGSLTADTATGAVTFTDVDLSDQHLVTISGVVASGTTSGLPTDTDTVLHWLSLGTLHDTTGSGTGGSDAWTFSAADKSFDYLAVGETVTLTYTVQVDDGHGGVVTQPVTITVTGTNDTPVITSGTQAGAITELSNPSQPNPTGSTALGTATGAVTFTDVDLSDQHLVTISGVVASGTTSGLPTDTDTVLHWLSLGTLHDTTGSGTGGSDAWTFSAADKSFDYLAAGETLTLTYTVQVDDGHGGVVTQPATITVTGTNDTPHITSGTQAAAITELANAHQPNPTGSLTADTATGAVTFTDVDLSDQHLVTITGVVASGTTSGLPTDTDTVLHWLSLGTLHDTTGTGLGGSDAWTFSAADKSFDYLAAGETLTLTYTVQVDDGHGGVVTQPVTITVTGTNDTPVITSGTQASAITELANAHQPNPTGSLTADTATGAVTFTDVDLSDQHLVTISGVVASGTTSGLPTDTDTVLHWLSLGTLHDTTGSGTGGSDAWTFSAADKSFDYLAVGETVTLTYTVQVDDGHGGVVTQPVTITVTGTNDTPVITSGTQAGAITELSNPSQPNPTGSTALGTATGAVTFTDVDLSDQHLVTISGVVASGTTSGLPTDTDTVLHWLSLGTLHDTTGSGTGGSDAWTFSAADKSFDYLAVGETVTLTYTVQVDDGHGGVVTQPVTITVTGTNDTPVISSGTQTGAITELAGTHGSTAPDTATGAVTFTDVDLSDHHTVTVTGVVASGITSGLPTDTTTVLNWLTLGTLTDSTNGATGSDAWTFSAQDKSFDYLAAGQTVTLTYTVQVSDGHGGVVTQPVAITITGTSEPGITVTSFTFDKSGTTDRFTVKATDLVPITSVEIYDHYGTPQQIDLGHATLSSGTGTNGTWTLSDLNNQSPANAITNHDTLTAVVSDGTSTASATLTLGDFDSDPAGVAGSPINLGLTQLAGVSNMAVSIEGTPLNWTMAGASHNTDGSWTAQTSDFSALTITPDVNYVGATLLHVTETWTNPDGSAGSAVVSDNVEAYAPGSPIFAVAGDDHLTGTGNGNLFVFGQPIGHDVVYNFNAALDKIDLIGFDNIAGFADIQGNITDDANGNAVITLGASETITLYGVDAASVTASDFVFNQAAVTQNPGTMQIGDGAHLALSGTINNTGTIELNSAGDETDLLIIQQGIALTGGGHLALSDSADNVIHGTSADVTLTNVDNTISGSGNLGGGQLTLVNDFHGIIEATEASNPLTIDVTSFVNHGLVLSNGAGGLEIKGGIDSDGVLEVSTGLLKVDGAFIGGGTAVIDGGRMEFVAASDAVVHFSGNSSGTLLLDDVSHFTGTVTGFSHGDTIDLAGIDPANVTVGNSGSLEVHYGPGASDFFSLDGNYDPAGFSVVTDHNGGTDIVWNNSAPVIETDQVSVLENSDGTATISGLQLSDSDPAASADTFAVTATAGTSESIHMGNINTALETITAPSTGNVAVTVTDSFGATDTVNFVFNESGTGPNVALEGTAGKDVIFATGQSDVLTGGGSQDQFVFAPTAGPTDVQHTITDFTAGLDKIDLRQFGNIAALSDLTEVQQGSDTLITLDSHDSLLLKNVAAASLSANDFILHPGSHA